MFRIRKDQRNSLLVMLLGLCWLIGCRAAPLETQESDLFKVSPEPADIPYATRDLVELYEASLAQEYIIGPGDGIHVDVWNRTKLTGDHIVGPYGDITLPMLGDFKIGGKNKADAAAAISDRYAQFYDDPIVTVKIMKFLNNKAYVLGNVSHPGVIHFSGEGSLLEALAMCGGIPQQDKAVFLSKCYIIRGRDQIIWIDLVQLLQKANVNLNVRLANNDVIYIPESMDAFVFVMGEVKSPGAYHINTADFSVLDAINMAGGPTEDADRRAVRLIRGQGGKAEATLVAMNRILKDGDFTTNYLVKDNDIVYLPKKGIAQFNYYLRQIEPFVNMFITGTIIHSAVAQ